MISDLTSKATDDTGISVVRSGSSIYLNAQGDNLNELFISNDGLVVTFGSCPGGPNIKSFTWKEDTIS